MYAADESFTIRSIMHLEFHADFKVLLFSSFQTHISVTSFSAVREVVERV